MEQELQFSESDLKIAKSFFNRVNGINSDFVTLDSWGEKNDTILIGGDPSYSIVNTNDGIVVYRITHHYSYESGWEDAEYEIKSGLLFYMALKVVAIQVTENIIDNEIMAMDHYSCYDELEFDED